MNKTEKQFAEILNSLSPLLETHNCFMELVEVKGNKAVIYCGGQGAICESKYIEEVLKEKTVGEVAAKALEKLKSTNTNYSS